MTINTSKLSQIVSAGDGPQTIEKEPNEGEYRFPLHSIRRFHAPTEHPLSARIQHACELIDVENTNGDENTHERDGVSDADADHEIDAQCSDGGGSQGKFSRTFVSKLFQNDSDY